MGLEMTLIFKCIIFDLDFKFEFLVSPLLPRVCRRQKLVIVQFLSRLT